MFALFRIKVLSSELEFIAHIDAEVGVVNKNDGDELISAVSRRFLVQISAQNLSQIPNVCVKVCTKQTQKARIRDKMRFTTKRA